MSAHAEPNPRCECAVSRCQRAATERFIGWRNWIYSLPTSARVALRGAMGGDALREFMADAGAAGWGASRLACPRKLVAMALMVSHAASKLSADGDGRELDPECHTMMLLRDAAEDYMRDSSLNIHHIHQAGDVDLGLHIDVCASCGRDIRHELHASSAAGGAS